MEGKELVQCYFCESKDVHVDELKDTLFDGPSCWTVECNSCLAHGPIVTSSHLAVYLWTNRRK